MKLNNMLSDFSGNMIYSKVALHEVIPRSTSFSFEIGRSVYADSHLLLAALIYYKSMLSRSQDVLLGIYGKDGVYRPLYFDCSKQYSINEFLSYAEHQIDELSVMSPEELFRLYRDNSIAFDEMDLTFSLDVKDHSDDSYCGIINIVVFDGAVHYHYDSVCVSEEEIARLHRRLSFIASRLAYDGSANLYDTDLIDENEKEYVNRINKQTFDRVQKPIHVFFSENAARFPDKVFAVVGEKSITYGEMERKSNQLARRLRALGCQRNEFIPIAIEKGIHYYIAFLGILKAGSAYMPIDITFPYERVRYMLNEAKPRVILTDGHAHYADGNEIEIDITDGECDKFDGSPIDNINDLQDYCSLYFTSGTTGVPKGAIGYHVSYVIVVHKVDRFFNLSGNEIVMDSGKNTFSYTIEALLTAIVAGLTIVVPTEDEIKDTVLFRRFLTEKKVDMMFITPQLFTQIDASGVRYISLGGGLVTQQMFEKGSEECGEAFFNIYGCSEATGISLNKVAHGTFTPDMAHIGKPFLGVHAYIMLNNHLCGVRMPGELCIGGDSVGAGYINNPKLTAEKFEFNEVAGERIYHTGDIAMFVEDGSLLIVGRMDDMVKIRGIRIEISEIEKTAARMEGVTGTVVTVKKNANESELCLYYTANRRISVKEMKDFLRKYLPDFMVPVWTMQIDAIPVSRHGKIDKKALPEITVAANGEIKEPVNALQREILNAFKEVLNAEDIGIDSDFFDCGGHSLRMTELINKIEEIKNIRLTVSEIFRERTVENIASLLEKKTSEKEVPFVKAEEKAVYEMSPIQRRMYAIYCADPSSLIYNEPGVIVCSREIDVERLERAINQEVARHDMLRTTFAYENDRFVQKIAEQCTVTIEVCENDDPPEEIAKRFVKPFDLTKLPAMRVMVVRQSDKTLIVTDMHHIYTDRVAVSELLHDVIALYQGKELPPVAWQYKDYSEWINKRDLSGQKQFWLKEFEDEIPQLSLPHKTKSTTRSNAGALKRSVISPALRSRIHDFASAHQLTDYMVMLSAFMILLQKYSGQEDFVVGMPVSARTHRNCKGIFGMFANSIPLRGRPEKNKSVKAFLAEMKETLLSAYQNGEYALDSMIDDLNERDGTQLKSLFDVMFVLQDSDDEFHRLGQYGLKELSVSNGTSDFDFTVNIYANAENGYNVDFDYATDWFDKAYFDSMAAAYNRILEQIPEKSEDPIQKIEVISEKDKALVLETFNDTQAAYDASLTILDAFKAQVSAHPDSVAVNLGSDSLTYAEFDRLSNRIARALLGNGVQKGDIIAIFGVRSVMTVAGIFGILKAGGAYLPIDPTYPEERIAFMLADSGAKVLVTAAGESPVSFGGTLLRISELDVSDDSDVAVSLSPSDLAYVIYTSGTTGKPKGVLLEHKGVLNLNLFNTVNLGISDSDVVLQFANMVFDASVWEIFCALLNGARLCMVSMETIQDTERMKQYIESNGVTTALFPPQYYMQLGEVGIRNIITGGSETNDRVIRKGMKAGRYFNAYGPTEATVIATVWHPAAYSAETRISIGKPLKNFKCYILDGTNLCGVEVPGELCVAGVSLARGYLNRPELTAEKFVDDPFGKGRMYRTGDLARWLPDGTIAYMGRIDQQVKVRGFRVELGEIEETIRQQPGIRDAAVVISADANGGNAIFAYLVADNPINIKSLKETIQKTLPEYMIPAGIMQLEKLPLTASGKLNAKALPAILNSAEEDYIAPISQLEMEIAAVFEDVLRKEHIGTTVSFYEVGGDSIKAIRVSSKLREKGYSVKVSDILHCKSVANIASFIKQTDSIVEEYNQDEVTGEIQLLPIHEQFFQWHLPKPGHFNQSKVLYGSYDPVVANRALNELFKHHDALRIVYDGTLKILPYRKQQFVMTVEVPWSGFDETKEYIHKITSMLHSGFDLENGPLMKAVLFKTNFGSCLVIIIHHLAVDIVSWGTLTEDFASAYSSFKNGREAVLPHKTASYQEWADKVNAYAHSATVRRNTPYWKEVNAAVKEGQLAGDEHGAYIRHTVSIEVDKTTTGLLKTKAIRAYGCDVRDLLLSALTGAVYDVTGQSRTSITLEGHGRQKLEEEIDISRTVGWFTVTPPVVTNYYDDIGALITETKEIVRRIPDGGMGYGLIIRELEEVNTPDILFNYFGEIMPDDEAAQNDRFDFPKGLDSAAENHFINGIDFNGGIIEGRLMLDMSYNAGRYSDAFAEKLAERFKKRIAEMTAVCAAMTETVKTPSDYGFTRLSVKDLRKIYRVYPQEQIDKIYPLTPMQEGLLYHKMLDEDSTSYVIQDVTEIEGNVTPTMIRKAVTMVVETYDALRTRILYDGMEEPVQVVLKEPVFDCEILELPAVTCDEMKEIAAREVRKEFDLAFGSPVHVTLIHADGRHFMIWTMHHVLIDGWCTGILHDTFLRFFRQLSAGESVSVTPDGTYADYVRWIDSQNREEGMNYYRSLLDGYDNVAEIRSLCQDPSKGEGIRSKILDIPQDLFAEINAYTKAQDLTVNDVVETALGLLLQFYTHSSDAVFGKVVSGRNAPIDGIDTAVGLFINTVPVRIHSQNAVTCGELLKSTARQNVESTSYHHLPLADVQSLSDVGSGLVKTILAFENYYVEEAEKSALSLSRVFMRDEVHHDLSFAAFIGEGLRILIDYRASQYSEQEIELIAERLTSVVRQLVESPALTVDEIAIATDSERNDILPAFSQPDSSVRDADCDPIFMERFEKQVKATPDRIAVVFGEKRLTYAAFNASANRLAHRLRGLGVKPNDFVVIMASPSAEMIAAVYGVMKSGAAHVPVDPHYPAERIRYMLDDCQPKCIVTAHTSVALETNIPLIDISDLSLHGDAVSDPEIVNKPEDTAYVIYTSGTTGNPKGVLIQHRSLSLYIDQFIRYTGVNADTVYLQQTYIGFDASVEELFAPLAMGGRMIVMPREQGIDLHLMLSLMTDEKVNMMGCVPMLANEMNHSGIPYAGKMIVGGSSMAYSHVDRLIENGAKVINAYGPTEATVSVTYFNVTKDCQSMKVIPIGKPVEHSQIFILSGDRLCGVGIPGELCIAGACLAAGYLRQPALTAEKFIDNPFGEGKLYRSGDLACWLPDGTIEFMGRIDDQVKIRGFRIELGEIEEVIRKQPGVVDAAVITTDDENGENAIYAYVVSDQALDTELLYDTIRQTLPYYMLPAGIMQIDAIPLTVNGKLNKGALPAVKASFGNGYVEPVTQTEKQVAALFAEILGLERTGLYDDFFSIGGHSLRAVRLVNRIEEATGVRLNIRDILTLKTVKNISRAIESADKSGYDEIPKAEEKDVYPVSQIEYSMYLASIRAEDSTLYNLPTMYRADNKLDVERLRAALKELVNRHEALRTAFRMVEGEIVQVIENVDFEMAYEETAEGTDEEIMNAFVRPFDLGKAPLFRAKMVDRGNYQLLLFDMHHIISDGATLFLLTDELISLYKGEALPPVRRQYKDYSEWIASQDIDAQKDYWLRQYENDIPVMNLPTDYPRGKIMTYTGSSITMEMGIDLKNRLTKLAGDLGTTNYVLLLSAVMILLGRYSHQEDIVIGSVLSGRNHRDLEDIAGMFIKTVPLRGYPMGSKSVRAFIAEMHQTFLDAEENQLYPFDDLVNALHIRRDPARNLLFDVLFVLDNNSSLDDRLRSAGIRDIHSEGSVAKFDISISVIESASGLVLFTEYNNSLYRPYFIEGLMAAYEKVLESIVEHIDASIGDLDFVSEKDRHTILYAFNSAEPPSRETYEETVVERFEKQAAAAPDRLAVICEDRRVTYRELNGAANKISHTLRRAGVKPEDFVVIFTAASAEMIAAVFGVLKSGAAYIPVDPNYPADRISFILGDCKPMCILTAFVPFPVETDIPIFDVSDVFSSEGDTSDPETIGSPDHAAYVIYTSGTTGNPKGVIVEHHSLSCYVDQFIDHFGVTEDTVYLQQTYIGFDASVEELYPALMTGGRTVVLPRDKGIDMERMISLIESEGINMITCVPVVANELNHLGVTFSGTLILGGSTMTYNNVDKLIEKGSVVYNTYGPTEATVCVSYYRVTKECARMHLIPIGKPIRNAQIYILNGEQLCGIGVPGELCIAGTGIVRGYLNQPELTAEKFIDNPFGEGKLYRSGDLARWLPDGNIEFMGRIDNQVKIRGFRVELEEIEETIRRMPEIRDVALVVEQEENGENAVLAYLVSDETINISALREKLRRKLPDYMLPEGMMQIERIPLTPNGKLNKRALPEIVVDAGNSIADPVNGLQRFVLKLWKKILKKPDIGIHSDYFDVGGNSLNILTLLNELKQKGFNVKVADLQTYTTVESLCSEILSKQEIAAKVADEEMEAEEIIIEKHDNMLNFVMKYYDDMRWDEYDCFFRPISVIAESFGKDYFDILTMNNAFYTLYGIDGLFDVTDYSNDQAFDDRFMEFFNAVMEKKIHVKMEKKYFHTEDDFHSLMKEAIDNGCPVLLPINSSMLIYSVSYLGDFSIHYMIVKGYDTVKRRYLVLDNLQWENGTGTVYNDFYLSFSDLFRIADFRHMSNENENSLMARENNCFIFKNTSDISQLGTSAIEEMHQHIQLLRRMLDGSTSYHYLAEKAIRSVYKMMCVVHDDSVTMDSAIHDPDISPVIQYYRDHFKESDTASLSEIIFQVLMFKGLSVETSLNMKPAYFKSLNSLLRKCSVRPEILEEIDRCEASVDEKWEAIKQLRIMLTAQEEVSETALETAVAEASAQERLLFEAIIACDGLIGALGCDAEKNLIIKKEAAARGYFLENLGNADIWFEEDIVRFELFPDKCYDLWENEDISPKIGKYVLSDDWVVSTTVLTDYRWDETHFNDFIVVYLKNSSKFLFGICKDDPATHFIRLYCPELGANYHLFVNTDQLDPDRVELRVRMLNEMIFFEYRVHPSSDWITAKKIHLSTKVSRVAITTKSWEKLHHIARFKDVKFSW